MIDMRPVGYVIGLLVTALGLTMLLPLMVDIAEARGQWPVFAQSMIITMLIGSLVALACRNGVSGGLTIQQTFLLTTGVWLVLPFFGALPFIIGSTELSVVDAVFEAMSGLTTTGSTVLSGLDDMPKGLLMWRGVMQWLGGVGIIVVAMVFLPELRVGGMQFFRTEAFETMGKILPRATQIAASIASIYLLITFACILGYLMTGMNAFDATVHSMTTVSTGGFSNYDASFGTFSGSAEWVATVFMILAALPFVRYVQLLSGSRALFGDSQVQVFLLTIGFLIVLTAVVLLAIFPHEPEQALREAAFNITSIMSGTGYASVDYMNWGPFLISIFFFIGLIGGCAGSTACSIKIFRYQILFSSIKTQIKRIHSPHGVFRPVYQGRPIDEDDVLNSVMSFFLFFVVTLGVMAVVLSLTGLDFTTSISGAATALANIGPGLGDIIGPAGNFAPLNDTAKWVLIAGMLIGRLEVLTVYAIFTFAFWRA
jgi:trk system potassium uptake protein TrkH